jgi:hypothetical protein
MWRSVGTTFEGFYERRFPARRQEQLTILVLIAVLLVSIALIVLIAWVDLFFVAA